MKKPLPDELIKLFIEHHVHLMKILSQESNFDYREQSFSMYLMDYVHSAGSSRFTLGQFRRFVDNKELYCSPLYEALS